MWYLALGMDSLSYFVMDPLLETPEWYGSEILSFLAADAPVYNEYMQDNLDTESVGVGLAGIPQEIARTGLPLVGVPFAGYAKNACCRLLTKSAVDACSDDELREILKANLILDGPAAQAVWQRGGADCIGGVKTTYLDTNCYEFYTESPINAGFENGKHWPLADHGKYQFECPADAEFIVAARYLDRVGKELAAASVLLTCKDGRRVCLLGYNGFDTQFISSSRVRFLNRAADWVSGGALSVMALEPVQCALIPRASGTGELRGVYDSECDNRASETVFTGTAAACSVGCVSEMDCPRTSGGNNRCSEKRHAGDRRRAGDGGLGDWLAEILDAAVDRKGFLAKYEKMPDRRLRR